MSEHGVKIQAFGRLHLSYLCQMVVMLLYATVLLLRFKAKVLFMPFGIYFSPLLSRDLKNRLVMIILFLIDAWCPYDR